MMQGALPVAEFDVVPINERSFKAIAISFGTRAAVPSTYSLIRAIQIIRRS
jgi:hypothetical protein